MKKTQMSKKELEAFLIEHNFKNIDFERMVCHDCVADEETEIKDALFSIMTDDREFY